MEKGMTKVAERRKYENKTGEATRQFKNNGNHWNLD